MSLLVISCGGYHFEENGGMTAFLSELQKYLEKENRLDKAESL